MILTGVVSDKPIIILTLFLILSSIGFADRLSEYGSYVNPHPRIYDRCPAPDLVKLSGCCNDVLSKLDDCKADDLACECCALQSIKPECYNLCPGNPSNNFLTVLYHDCENLNEINACSLPFKKDDSLPQKYTKKFGNKGEYLNSKNAPPYSDDKDNSVVVKSKLSSKTASQNALEDILNDDNEIDNLGNFEVKMEKETFTNVSALEVDLLNMSSNISNSSANVTYTSVSGSTTKNFILSITLGATILLAVQLFL